jgi:hypothetical protein
LEGGSELLDGSGCDVEDRYVGFLGRFEVVRGYICGEKDVRGGFDIFGLSLPTMILHFPTEPVTSLPLTS